MTFTINTAPCPECHVMPGDECLSPNNRIVKTHAARKKYATAMQIDREQGRTAARKFLPSY